jgi:hypothetical protein
MLCFSRGAYRAFLRRVSAVRDAGVAAADRIIGMNNKPTISIASSYHQHHGGGALSHRGIAGRRKRRLAAGMWRNRMKTHATVSEPVKRQRRVNIKTENGNGA